MQTCWTGSLTGNGNLVAYFNTNVLEICSKAVIDYCTKTRTIIPPRWQQQGQDHSWAYLFNDWSDRYGLPHGKKVSSVDAIVCVATIAHSQWKSLITWTNLSNNGHIDKLVGECNLSVDTSCKAHGVLDPCTCSNHTDRA